MNLTVWRFGTVPLAGGGIRPFRSNLSFAGQRQPLSPKRFLPTPVSVDRLAI